MLNGVIEARQSGNRSTISRLEFTYPLRLTATKSEDLVQRIYMINFGGGLVSGDVIHLEVKTIGTAYLILLTQASTKVHKQVSHNSQTKQTMNVEIMDSSSFVLIPEPITCFKSATYKQQQTFQMSQEGSIFLVDWVTAGRYMSGERWMANVSSRNEIYVCGKLAFLDTWCLDSTCMPSTIYNYTNICTVVVIGPRFPL